MTDFTREQAKELLMREVELTHEVATLEKCIEEKAKLFDKAAAHLREVLKENKQINTDVDQFTLECLQGKLDVDDIKSSLALLREKRTELEDTTRMLRYVR